MNFILREAWYEMRSGLKGGVIPLVYLALTGYLLMVITECRQPAQPGRRGCTAQRPRAGLPDDGGDGLLPLLRLGLGVCPARHAERQAQLHELVLTAPRSLRQLLLARYLGALGVALVLGTAQFLGFCLAPVMEAMGTIPTGSVAATPWLAFGWAWLIFTLPLAVGAGALYYTVALYSRSVAGPSPSRPYSWASGWWP
jgi:hypothetical protein